MSNNTKRKQLEQNIIKEGFKLDLKRAKQIISSPEKIDVAYHGVSVWLKNCNEQNQQVSIFDLDNPEDVRIVPVNELEEML